MKSKDQNVTRITGFVLAILLALPMMGMPAVQAEDVWVWPVPGSYVINSLDVYQDGSPHNEGQCIDIGHNGYNGSQRLDIVSCTSGVVERTVTTYGDYNVNDGSWGNYVMIRYNSIYIVYAHLQSVSVKKGQKVSAGTVLGKMGTSGNSTGVHLHLQAFPVGASSSDTTIKVFDKFKDNPDYIPKFRFLKGLATHSARYGSLIRSKYTKLSGSYYVFSGQIVQDTGIKLDHSSIALQLGESFVLKASVLPDNASNKQVIFFSENESVASIGADGTVRANGYGTTYVGARSASGHEAKCKVTVESPYLTYGGKTYTDVKLSDWHVNAVKGALANHLFYGTSDSTFEPDSLMTRGMLATVIGRMAGADVSEYTTSRFLDLDMNQYYAGPVVWADKMGFMSGVGSDMFEPEEPLTREQLCSVIVRYYELTGKKLPKEKEKTDFADEEDMSSWAVDAIYKAQQAGLMTGRGENRFVPQDYATRAEVATVLLKVQDSVR
ncbi:MAG: peptidoglycan DD-metalloendopeptidase family protein [Clostridiales bacterium]|nr:peptidoglycan DD-metalloendopeptidase family protein [Clostridiales bacterium]